MVRKARLSEWMIGGAAMLALVVTLAVPFFLSWRSRPSLQDPNPAVRVAALRSTGYAGHIDLLMQGLQDQDADVRLVAAMQLKSRRAAAGPATEALIEALHDRHAGVRREAAEALSVIGAAAAPGLVETLADPNPQVRLAAIRGLDDPYKDIRQRSTAEHALVIPAMRKLLQDPDPDVRKRAATFLEHYDDSVVK